MIKRQYGKHKEFLSVIGLGGIAVKGQGQNNASNLVSLAYDHGVNYFDVEGVVIAVEEFIVEDGILVFIVNGETYRYWKSNDAL